MLLILNLFIWFIDILSSFINNIGDRSGIRTHGPDEIHDQEEVVHYHGNYQPKLRLTKMGSPVNTVEQLNSRIIATNLRPF